MSWSEGTVYVHKILIWFACKMSLKLGKVCKFVKSFFRNIVLICSLLHCGFLPVLCVVGTTIRCSGHEGRSSSLVRRSCMASSEQANLLHLPNICQSKLIKLSRNCQIVQLVSVLSVTLGVSAETVAPRDPTSDKQQKVDGRIM